MNFYLDFEATQFSNRIISIGCVAENGEKFNTLVKPVNNEKVGKYITELTGITNEMVAEAPTADEAFIQFFGWFMRQDAKLPTFYAYGDDWRFIDATVKYMDNTIAIMFANSIKGCMVDYSKIATKHLARKSIALRSLVAMVQSTDEVVQRHDALEDAEWLMLVANNLDKIPAATPEVKVKTTPRQRPTTDIRSIGPFPTPVFTNLKLEPEHINRMRAGQAAMWDNLKDGSLGSKDDWKVRIWNDNNGGHEAFFRNVEDAVYWTFKASNGSLKKADTCRKRWLEICRHAENGTKCCHVFWEIKPVEQKEEK